MRMGGDSAVEGVAFSLPQKWAHFISSRLLRGRGKTFEAEFSVLIPHSTVTANVLKQRAQVYMQGPDKIAFLMMSKPQNPSIQSLFSFRFALLILFGCFLITAAQAAAQAPAPDSPELEAKARAMLARLTLEQKIELLGGMDDMFTRPMPAIGLPRFKMSDGPVGVKTWGPSTAFAGGVALAATWDKDFARRLGQGLGRDARARSVHILLGPGHG